MPFCNSNLDYNIRVTNFVNSLTFEEKMSQFVNGAGPIPRYNIPAY